MQLFSGYEYLLIDVANHAPNGLNKQEFDQRIAWAEKNLAHLEDIGKNNGWKERPMFIKATQAIRKAQQKTPSGHLVGFDAVCSGMQIMSALTGCKAGAEATGLVDPHRRADAYTDCTSIMARRMGVAMQANRPTVKNAVMTALYGSKKEPEKEFGKHSIALTTFWDSLYELAPGACEMLQALLDSWNAWALSHEWVLPDGYQANVKVMQQTKERIEVDELNHSTFTYQYYVNEGEERGVKNAANVTHSVDAYVLRSLIRRCNYDWEHAEYIQCCIGAELLGRDMGTCQQVHDFDTDETVYYRGHYDRSSVADIVILPYLDQATVSGLSDVHLKALSKILDSMLRHMPFEVITVHDDFKCHPNNMNHLRAHYRDILAELADSNLLNDLLTQLYGQPVQFTKLSPNLGDTIRKSNYALC